MPVSLRAMPLHQHIDAFSHIVSVTTPDWGALAVQLVPGVLTAVVSVGAIWFSAKTAQEAQRIAARQQAVTEDRLRYDLFDRRYAAFKAFDTAARAAQDAFQAGDYDTKWLAPCSESIEMISLLFEGEVLKTADDITRSLFAIRTSMKNIEAKDALPVQVQIGDDIQTWSDATTRLDRNLKKLHQQLIDHTRLGEIK